MTLQAGQEVELSIEKPAAGGRMIARHGGEVILVQGAIPGERVRARIERAERRLAFATTVDVIEPSPDRQDAGADPLCGGCVYAHVAYARQLQLKAAVIHDAFARLGRIPLADAPAVAASPPRGYRMRARLHARGERIGSYREGTRDLCDVRATGQLSDGAVDAAERTVRSLVRANHPVDSVLLAENIAADERVLHVVAAGGDDVPPDVLETTVADAGVTGCSIFTASGTVRMSGIPVVGDPLAVLSGGRAAAGRLERHAESFFQANRFLLPALVQAVMAAIPGEGAVLDLYAGVGLFSISLAASGRGDVTAVEGDRTSGRDLQRNAAAAGAGVRVAIESVEEHLGRRKGRPPGTVIVDPPRTGISKQAMEAAVRLGAPRVVYVSCDPPTMARDARRLLDGGYRLSSLQAFDLFPNTPHVESLGIFDR